MKNLFLLTMIVLLCGCTSVDGSNENRGEKAAEKVNVSTPFFRGVNFTQWFETSSARSIVFTTYTEQDFINVKSMGADVVRLPIRMHDMTSGAPDYKFDPLFFQLLDQVVDWAEKHELYLIIDNHTFDPVAHVKPSIEQALIPVWKQIAERYKNRTPYIIYEIFNEPHGISARVWGEIQGRVVKAIREIDPDRYIIVGGVGYNSIDELFNIPKYEFNNLIYTFHFYDPYLFTHQGETWGSPPNLRNLRDLPFPGDIRPMPPVPPDLRGTWVEANLRHNYRRDASVPALTRQMNKAVRFANDRGVPVFCGEFGVIMTNTKQEDRVRWYEAVTKLLDERGISRTSWDYYGAIGLFNTEGGGCFESDLNVEVVKALGFNPPPQRPAEKIRSSITIFDHYASPLVRVTNWNCNIDLYYPEGEKFLLNWNNAGQYGDLSFHFRRSIDWEYLASQGYALVLTVKSDKPVNFGVRFTNHEIGGNIPWRAFSDINLVGDGKWLTLRLPLQQFTDQGAWLNSVQEWRPSEGKFVWEKVSSLSIVAEYGDIRGVNILFGNIKIDK